MPRKLHCYLVSVLFSSPQKEVPRSSHSLLLPPRASGNCDLLSVSMDLFLLDISHKPNDKVCGLAHLAPLTLRNSFKAHPHCSMCQCFLPARGWITCHWTERPQFVYAFICWWTFGLFHVLATVNSAAVNWLHFDFPVTAQNSGKREWSLHWHQGRDVMKGKNNCDLCWRASGQLCINISKAHPPNFRSHC